MIIQSAWRGSTGSRSSGRSRRPISPENHSRFLRLAPLPFSSISITTAAEPRICPASTSVTITPGTTSNGSS